MKIAAGHQYSMAIVSNYTCFGKTSFASCSGYGICTNTDVCSCGFDFEGKECQFTTCSGKNSSNPKVCSGNGLCTAKNNCTCFSGYYGYDCEFSPTYESQTTVYSCGNNQVNYFIFIFKVWSIGSRGIRRQ
jgi:hypothetical protein